MSTNVENIMTQDVLQYFSVYGDENLTTEIGANDVLDLCDMDNTVTIYIALNDYLSINDQAQLGMVMDGEYKTIFFDIVRNIDGNFFRNYDLVESIETEFFFDTKPLIENLIEKLDGEPFINVMNVLEYFSFGSLQFRGEPPYESGFDSRMLPITEGAVSYFKNNPFGFYGDFDVTLDTGRLFDIYVYNKKDVFYMKRLYHYMVEYIDKQYELAKIKNDFYLTNIPTGLDINPDYLTLIEKIYTTNYVRDCLDLKLLEHSDTTIRDSIMRSALYWNGCIGKSHINILGDIKPTCYLIQDEFKNYTGDSSSTYRLSKGIHEVFQRWYSYLHTESRGGGDITISSNDSVIKYFTNRNSEFKDYKLNKDGNKWFDLVEEFATGLVGLGRVSTLEQYNDLYPYLVKDGAFKSRDSNALATPNYFLFTTPIYKMTKNFNINKENIWTTINMQKIIYAAVHNNGNMHMYDGDKNILEEQGQGTEHVFFESYDSFCKRFDIDLNYITRLNGKNVGSKSLSLMSSIRDQSEIPTEKYCEFYDRNHPSPLNDIYAYVPIPLTPGNFQYKDIELKDKNNKIVKVDGHTIKDVNKGLYRIGSVKIKEEEIRKLINSNLVIHKRKRSEDADGNVTIEDLGEKVYPGNTWKIPFNKDEYLYKCSCNAVHTFLSRDMKFKIKIKFKKNPNREQNIYFRLFAHDYTFGRMFYIKRKR